MTKMYNFRLNESTITLLEELAKTKNKTKTKIVREAIANYYIVVSEPKNSLLEFAGTVSNDTSEKMKAVISKNRSSKPVLDL